MNLVPPTGRLSHTARKRRLGNLLPLLASLCLSFGCTGDDPSMCDSNRDCSPFFTCVDGTCLPSQNFDAGLNPESSSCTNEVRDGNETDIDCGAGCKTCLEGQGCRTALDCLTANCQFGVCGPLPSCDDAERNGGETDIDCGGNCAPCGLGGACGVPGDCATQLCEGGTCAAAPSCVDGQQNGNEVDVDCGGDCDACDVGQRCTDEADCVTADCSAGVCVALPTCNDGQLNGNETDVDCGGNCSRCDVGLRCVVDNDCNGDCSSGTCVPTPTCTDGQQNGNETDVDCGGGCGPCRDGQRCGDDDDCEASHCSNGFCLALPSCNALHQARPGAPSGRYFVDPDGSGPEGLIRVYCDMSMSGGGWTLVMRLDGGTELSYGSAHWTTESLLRADALSPTEDWQSAVNAKFEAFDRVRGNELALEWIEPSNNRFVYSQLANRTALALFQGPEQRVAGRALGQCNGESLTGASGYDASRMRHGRGAQFFGINGVNSSHGITTRMRFGFGSNDEDNALWYPHHGVGIGGAQERTMGVAAPTSILWDAHTDCNGCGCYGQGESFPAAAANLWVR